VKDLVTVRIESPAFDADAVRVAEITGTESISRLFEMTLRLVALDPAALDEEKLLTSAVDLVFERTDDTTHVVTEERRIGGMLSTLRDRFLTESAHREMIATFVPKAWQTTLTKTTDIFMDMSIPEIVQKKLETGAALVSPDVEMRLGRTYPKREFVVQYKESDYDFICRLTEDLGIHFFFERKGDKDVIVFADENTAFKPTLPEQAPFMKRGESIGVHDIEATRKIVPRVFKARDYNYRNPSMDLLGEVDAKSLGSAGMVDEFGPHAKSADEVKFYATVRAQEANARHFVFEGHSDLPGLRAGSVLTIEGHPRGELKLVVIEVRHDAKQAIYGAAAGDAGYRNSFQAIPEKVAFRPERITPKPVVHGVVTGIVQSESATNFGAIDAEGRYRVSFMYDTVSDRGEGKASRPLRMAQPSAGADRGFHQPLKAGTEVIITCLNGDPDRPIISGAVTNPQTPSPVTSANAEKSMWKTNVSQMAFDDDQPRMKMTVNGDHIFQIGEPNGPELGFYMQSTANYTNTVSGVATQVASTLSTIQELRTAMALKNIIDAAGVPKNWNILDHVEKWGGQVVGWAKTAAALPTDLKKASLVEAGASKKEAEDAQAAAKSALTAKIKESLKAAPPQPMLRTHPDGTTHTETADQALDRVVAQQVIDDTAFDKALTENDAKILATTPPAERQKLLDENNALKEKRAADLKLDTKAQDKESASDAIDHALKKHSDTTAAVRKANADADDAAGNEKKLTEEWAKSPYNLETGLVADIIKDGEAAVNAITAGKKLASAFSDVMSEVLDQTQIAAMVAQIVRAAGTIRNSGQRKPGSVGKFSPPANVQYSSNSVGIHGVLSAALVSKSHADVFARYTTVSGLHGLHLKSTLLVETAAKDVFISAKHAVDIDSRKTVLIVGGSPGVKVDGASSVVVHGQKDVHLVSDDKSVHVKAQEHVSVLASTGNLVLTAKKKDLLASAQEGKFELEALKGTGKIASKGKLTVKTEDAMTIGATKSFALNAEAFGLTTKKAISMKGDKLTVKLTGDAAIKGSKIKLG